MAHEIFQAIRQGDTDRARQIITSNPAAAHERDEQGVSAIMQARYQRQQPIADLLRSAAGKLDVFEAAALGDTARLNLLLRNEPEGVCSFSADGFTALHFAAFFSQPQAARELLNQGADPNAIAANGTKLAVINSAAASGNAEIVKMLLQEGANPDSQQEGGYTALHSAAHNNNVEMVRALIEAGADISIRTNDGKTALEMAGPQAAAVLRTS